MIKKDKKEMEPGSGDESRKKSREQLHEELREIIREESREKYREKIREELRKKSSEESSEERSKKLKKIKELIYIAWKYVFFIFFYNSRKKNESSEDRKQFLLKLIRLFGIKLREKDPNYKNRSINSLLKQLKRISCETVDLEIYKDSENSGIVSLDLDLDGKDYIDARRAFT